MRQIIPAIGLLLLSGVAAAAQTSVTSATFDTTSGDSIAAAVSVGSIAAGGTLQIKLQGGEMADGSDKRDISDAVLNLVAADANKIAVLEIHRPPTKYVTVVVTRAVANSDLVSIHGLLFGAYNEPVAQPQVSKAVALVSPSLVPVVA